MKVVANTSLTRSYAIINKSKLIDAYSFCISYSYSVVPGLTTVRKLNMRPLLVQAS